LLATFAVFAVSFFMRPVGAFVFGRYGDKIGCRSALAATVILMGLATFMIGVLPTYVARTLGFPLSQALRSNAIGLAVLMVLILFTGALSDRVGRKPLLLGFSALITVLTYRHFCSYRGAPSCSSCWRRCCSV
jgi:MFS family permease